MMPRVILLAATAAFALASPLTAKAKGPGKLEGMSYLAARKVIVGYGWVPVRGGCSGGGSRTATCTAFPEIGNCSGTGVGFCDMTFARKNRCLLVVTMGGSPDIRNSAEPAVRDVTFSRGPCSKE